MISKNIVKILKQSLVKEGHASLLVCGGSSPLKIFHELNQAKLDWKNITISLIDDRIVNNDHPDSNEFLVKSHLLKNLAADAKFISLNNDHELLLKDRKRFDVAIIGMGPDGHFASLFPSMISTTNYLDHLADPAIILTDLIGSPEYMRTSMNLSMRFAPFRGGPLHYLRQQEKQPELSHDEVNEAPDNDTLEEDSGDDSDE